MLAQLQPKTTSLATGTTNARIGPDRDVRVLGHFEQPAIQQVMGHRRSTAVPQKG
jgi:hypothetical protein